MENNHYSLFVSCGPCIEPLLLKELEDLGIKGLREGYRGIYVDEWDNVSLYRINYGSRLASRVLLPLIRFRCRDQKSLYQNVSKIDWLSFLKSHDTLAIDANVRHPQLRNSLFAAQIVKDAICDQIRNKTGNRPSVDLKDPDLQLNLFIEDEIATLSLDTSGAPLHKRGYRQATVDAPMQENLAAALLRLARYNPEEDIFLDPCCGSGTLLIEAALIATKTPPGFLRHKWGFMRHPAYDNLEWLKVRNELDAQRKPLLVNKIFGIDRSASAARAAKINVKCVGFHKEIEVIEADFREYTPTITPNFILANPPHGKRLDDEELLRSLYRDLGNFIKRNTLKPARAFIFTSSLNLAKEVGLAASKRHVLMLGGLEARLLEYPIF